jgi:lipoprotein-anchoring transpeptidase ErfK/SrfK
MWSEITVPIVTSKSGPGPEYYNRETHYYSQIQRVVGLENGYYKVAEIYGGEYWLPANTVRLMSAEEWAPISTHVAPEAKKIVVSVGDSRLRAYEGGSVVYDVPVSLGMVDTPTPLGTFHVLDKRHGQRMVGGLTGGGYNLAGIGSISYITSSWVAMHACYWHNDYGRRHSNGCINLHPRDAKWIFRWTTPYANYWDFRTLPNPAAGQPGTTVTIQW